MHLVVFDRADGSIELNYTWLPTWLGIDPRIRVDVMELLKPTMFGRQINEDVYHEMDKIIVDWLVEKHPAIPGLRRLLEAVLRVDQPEAA